MGREPGRGAPSAQGLMKDNLYFKLFTACSYSLSLLIPAYAPSMTSIQVAPTCISDKLQSGSEDSQWAGLCPVSVYGGDAHSRGLAAPQIHAGA